MAEISAASMAGAASVIKLPSGFSLGRDKHTGLPTLKISVPDFVAQVGARRWLATRALHLPEEVVTRIAPIIEAKAEAYGADHPDQPKAEFYIRAIEETLVDMLYDGVLMPAVEHL